MGNPKSTTLGVNPEVEDQALTDKLMLMAKSAMFVGKIVLLGQLIKQVLFKLLLPVPIRTWLNP